MNAFILVMASFGLLLALQIVLSVLYIHAGKNKKQGLDDDAIKSVRNHYLAISLSYLAISEFICLMYYFSLRKHN